MKYSCGCRADLAVISKDLVRDRVCPNHSPEGQRRIGQERQQMRESERRNMLTQASLNAIGMGKYGPLPELDPRDYER